MKSTESSARGQQESSGHSNKASQKPLTPLGALPRLQRDERERQFFTGDHALLKILVQRCEKTTGEVRGGTLVDIARACGRKSGRSVRRHLRRLEKLEILAYIPGGTQGRGSPGRIMLLYESWGNTKTIHPRQPLFKERGTPMSPFSPAKQGNPAQSSSTPHGEEVECTLPFMHTQCYNVMPVLSYEERKASELARAFYDRVGIHKRYLSKVDLQTAAHIRHHYNRKHRRKALSILLTYYEKKHRRKKIRGIGILRFYCENLDTIKAGLKFDWRVAQWHRDQTQKQEEQKRQIKENHNQEVRRIEQARQKITQNPWDSWSRAELRLPLYPTDEEILEWKRQHPELHSNGIINNTEPTALMNQSDLPTGIGLSLCHDWVIAMNRLREKLFKTSFNTWIRPLIPLSRQGDVWRVRAPSSFSAKWVEENSLDDLVRALGADACVYLSIE